MDCQPGKQQVALRHMDDALLDDLIGPQAIDACAGEADLSRADPNDAGDHFEQGRFAVAIGSDDRSQFAFADSEVGRLQDDAAGIAGFYAVEHQRRLSHAHAPFPA